MRHLGHYWVPGATCDVWLVGPKEIVVTEPDFELTDNGQYYDGKIYVRENSPTWVQEHEKQHWIDEISGAGMLMKNLRGRGVKELDEVLIRIRSPWLHLCKWQENS